MIAKRMLVGIGLAVIVLGTEAKAGPWSLFQPSRLTAGETRLVLRPWRADTSAPLFQSAAIQTFNTLDAGGEIILASNESFRPAANRPFWNPDPTPPPATPAPEPSPAPAAPLPPPPPPVSIAPIPVFQPLVLGGFQAPVTAPAPAPAVDSFVTGGLGIIQGGSPTINPTTYDAKIDFGTGPFPGASTLSSADPKVWVDSPVVTAAFGHTPSAAEQSAFTSQVLDVVHQTYLDAGLHVSLTSDPNADAAHTLSVVSNAGFPSNDKAIGIADIGGNGFSFIDKFTPADTLDKLEVALGKNIAHELMHTFGVEHHDTTGVYLDGAVSNWNDLFNRSTGFSADAIADLASKDFQAHTNVLSMGAAHAAGHAANCNCPMCRGMANAQMVPEPSAVAVWAIGLAGVAGWIRSGRKRAVNSNL